MFYFSQIWKTEFLKKIESFSRRYWSYCELEKFLNSL